VIATPFLSPIIDPPIVDPSTRVLENLEAGDEATDGEEKVEEGKGFGEGETAAAAAAEEEVSSVLMSLRVFPEE